MEAIKKPPIKAEDIILHEPNPVINNIAAPINTANTDVSPIEPGIKPAINYTKTNKYLIKP